MAREPKALGPVDRHVVGLLASAAEAADVSQRALESRTGISQGRIGKILRGETPPPSIGEMDALAQALGMKASDVFRDAEALVDEDQRASRPHFGLAASRHDLSRELPNQDEPA